MLCSYVYSLRFFLVSAFISLHRRLISNWKTKQVENVIWFYLYQRGTRGKKQSPLLHSYVKKKTVAPLECDDWSSCNWCLAFQKKAPHAKKLWISLNLWMGFGVLFSEPPKQIVGLKRAAPNPSPSPAVPISPLLLKYWRWPLSLIFILLLFVLSFMRRRLITN